MPYFTTRKTFLVPSFDLEAKEREKMDRFLLLLKRSGVESFLPEKDDFPFGRPPYACDDLLATILYGFAFGSPTLRDLEDSCKYDLRYFYLMEQDRPKHSIFGNFINDIILPNRRPIFSMITKAIMEECGVVPEETFIDGTKFEADANKYKFVWKPTKYHQNLSDKIRALLREAGLNRGVPEKEILPSSLVARKLSELSALAKDGYCDEALRSRLNEFLIKALEYEEKERICGPDRNSYYKTDHGATAMTLKSDYYSGLGSNMHAAYTSQLLVSKGIICAHYTSQSRNDMSDFIPILQRFYEDYGYHPKSVCADAAYGSLENYRYLHDHQIGNYVKYTGFQGNVSGKNPDRYFLNEDGTLTCLNGFTGKRSAAENRHPKTAEAVFYRVDGCSSCTFSPYCKRFMNRKDEDFRIFEVQEELSFYKQEAFQNLLSPKGIEMRVNRSTQAEGVIGVVKEDMSYRRLRRTSLERADNEFALTYLGYNIRKLFRHFDGKAKFSYWTAPKDLEPEIKKNPSAKRLAKRVQKKRRKTGNEKAKDYTYKT